MEKLLAAVTNPWALIAFILFCIMWMLVGQRTDNASRRILLRGFLGLALLVVEGVLSLQSQTTRVSAAQDINVQEATNTVTGASGAVTITGNSGTSNVGTNNNNTTQHGTMNGNGSTYNFGGGTTVIESGNAHGNGNSVSVHIGR